MNPLLLLASTAKAQTSVMDALPHLAGVVMVMVSLTILWWVCALTARIIRVLTPEPVAEKPAPRVVKKSAPAEPDGLSPEIVAVIAAAVAATVGRKCRIISIKPQSSSWERAGRHAVLSSHRIR